MQDMGVSTASNREYLIRRFLRPGWGSVMLSAMGHRGDHQMENGLPAREGISRRTAGDARSLLGTILGDAAAHKPPLIPYNPALRPRNRGRKTGRRLGTHPAACLGNAAPGVTPRRTGRAADRPGGRLHA